MKKLLLATLIITSFISTISNAFVRFGVGPRRGGFYVGAGFPYRYSYRYGYPYRYGYYGPYYRSYYSPYSYYYSPYMRWSCCR